MNERRYEQRGAAGGRGGPQQQRPPQRQQQQQRPQQAQQAPQAQQAQQATRGLIESKQTNEVTPSGLAAAETAEIQAAILIAHNLGRSEEDAYGALMAACGRTTFQEKAVYRFKRGSKQLPDGRWVDNFVEGPSVHMAREFARHWRHLRYGFRVVSEDEDRVQIRGFAWDMLTNEKVEQDASFRKLIFRKNDGWIRPDERDLRELINKHGAIAERNCLLKVLPSDMVEDACQRAQELRIAGIKNDMEAARKKIVAAFAEINVSATQVEDFLDHPIAETTPKELAELRSIWASIRDGNGHWSEHARERDKTRTEATTPTAQKPGAGSASVDDLTRRNVAQIEAVAPGTTEKALDAAERARAPQQKTKERPAAPPPPAAAAAPPAPPHPPAKQQARKSDEGAATPVGTRAFVSAGDVDPADLPTPFERWRDKIEKAKTQDEADELLSSASSDDEVSAEDWNYLAKLIGDRWENSGGEDEIPF